MKLDHELSLSKTTDWMVSNAMNIWIRPDSQLMHVQCARV